MILLEAYVRTGLLLSRQVRGHLPLWLVPSAGVEQEDRLGHFLLLLVIATLLTNAVRFDLGDTGSESSGVSEPIVSHMEWRQKIGQHLPISYLWQTKVSQNSASLHFQLFPTSWFRTKNAAYSKTQDFGSIFSLLIEELFLIHSRSPVPFSWHLLVFFSARITYSVWLTDCHAINILHNHVALILVSIRDKASFRNPECAF